jgi:hypothetical protein
MQKAITLIVGLLSLIIGLALVHMRVSKIKAGIVTDAAVAQIKILKGSENETLYKPIFRFKNYKNEQMIYTPSFSSSDSWIIGEKIKIVYTKDSDKVYILSYWKTFGIALFFFCVAAVAFLIAGGEYVAGRFFRTLSYPNH